MLKWCLAQMHQFVALLAVFLLVSSPWLSMAIKVPAMGFGINQCHLIAGMISGGFGLVFLLQLLREGLGRQYFFWCYGDFAALKVDFKKLRQKQLPASGGRGLFSLIAGLTLLSFVAVFASGVAWLVISYTGDAAQTMFWRDCHQNLAFALIILLGLHLLAILSHLKTFFEH